MDLKLKISAADVWFRYYDGKYIVLAKPPKNFPYGDYYYVDIDGIVIRMYSGLLSHNKPILISEDIFEEI